MHLVKFEGVVIGVDRKLVFNENILTFPFPKFPTAHWILHITVNMTSRYM